MGPQQRVLVVGAGSIGERHVRCFLATQRAQVALVEINPTLREEVARRYNIPGYASLPEALDSQSTFDAAVVAIPAHLHLKQARTLVDAGLHILIEKPLDTHTLGANTVAELAGQRGLRLAVAYVYRAQPALARLREALHSGRFGQPVELVAVCGQNFPTYRPAYRQTYYSDHATGGGAIQDALTHVLNAGEWLVGPIDRLVADAAHRVLEGVEVEDTVHVLARHGEVLASYSLNQHQAPNEMTLSVVCERGTLRWELPQNRFRWLCDPDQPWQEETFPPQQRDDVFIAQANHFLDSIEGIVEPLCSFEEGLQTLRVNRAALTSVSKGSWQRVADQA